MQKTTAPNSSGGAFVDEVPGITLGTTWQAADANAHQNEICNAITYNSGAGTWAGQTLSGADLTQLYETIVKASKEFGKPVGELFYELDYSAPVAFNAATPWTYRPYLCIDTPSGSPGPTPIVVTSALWPQLNPYLLAFTCNVYDGQAGQTSQFSVTTGVVNSNIVTLTLTSNNGAKAICLALSEDSIVNNNGTTGFLAGTPSYSNWISITIPSAITIGSDTINAGTYQMVADSVNNGGLAVDPVALKVSFSYSAANQGSIACTGNVKWCPFAVAGSSNAQIMAMQGRTLISPNDLDPVLFSGAAGPRYVPGLRTRDRIQGHWHDLWATNNANTTSGSGGQVLGTTVDEGGNNVRGAVTDGVNGTPRLGGTSDPRALTAHLYIHGGQYV